MVALLDQLCRVGKLTGSRRRVRTQRGKKDSLACESLEMRVLLSAITGTIYDDADSSGSKTGGDNTLSGWQIYVDIDNSGTLNNRADGTPEPSAFGNSGGDFTINMNSMPTGVYRVAEIVQPGWTPTAPASREVEFTAGRDSDKIDFFNFAGGNIVGTVWEDLNQDGIRATDPVTGAFTDPGLAGWTVFLDMKPDGGGSRNGIPDPGEPTTETDALGGYSFLNLPSDDYEVTEVLPDGWDVPPGFDTRQTATVVPLGTTTLDFANFSDFNGSIEGTVWNDVNGDGDEEIDPVSGLPTDPGLAEWTVYIDANANGVLDAAEQSTTTDAAGNYNFVSVPAGVHRVREVLPPKWSPSPGYAAQQIVSVIAGEKTNNVDFANFTVLNGSIRGSVWNDLNRDGVRNAEPGGAFTDPGLADWTVYLDMNRNGVLDTDEPTALTDANGLYVFPDLQIGEYKVFELVPTGWETAPTFDDSYTVRVFSGAESVAHDFANFSLSTLLPGSVSGTVWNDQNENGVLDTTPAIEPGLGGRVLFADANSNGILDVTDPQTTTNADGTYTISGIAPGSVNIHEVVPSGWRATSPSTGVRSLVLKNGEHVTGINYGNAEPRNSTISGTVFADTNKNGIRDAGEHGLAGITVYLDLNTNGALDATDPHTVTTADLYYTPSANEAGSYSFPHLASGTYLVRQVIPVELSATPSTQFEHSVTMLAAENHSGIDFADVFRLNQIHGVKFDDVNGNRVRDAGEGGVGGATIFIDSDRDDIFDPDELSTLTDSDGSYSFTGLTPGAYVVREVLESGRRHSYPTTTGGILWPTGTSNPAQGIVTPGSITTSLAVGQSYHQTVSLTLPGTGALTNAVDVFLLFDDTGSFVNNSPIVRAAFPNIISQLQTSLSGTDLAFGVGRFEEYGNFAAEYSTGRPFVLNQPIVASSTAGYMAAIQAALNRTTPGYGGDGPETDIEALYQLVTGLGFDGNNNGTVTDSGVAGLGSTQLFPGNSGDVPSFASFTADASANVLPAAGTIGGAGFRAGALPVILLATDIGFAYQPNGETSITGANGLTLPVGALTGTSRPSTPFNSGAGLQETITGLNALGALVIGLGTNPQANVDPRQGLEAISKLTGAINRTTTTIANGTTDPIAPGDPLYFQISSGFATSVADGVRNAIQNAVSNVAMNITVQASDPRVRIINHTGARNGVGSGQTATFDIEFIGDGIPHRFDLQFVREGTNVVLGSIPVVLGTPIPGDGYHFDDLDEGEIEFEDDFSDSAMASGNAPTDISLSAAATAENQSSGVTIGTLNTTDPDSGDTFTYTLVTGAGSVDNSSFSIDGANLSTASAFNYEAQNNYSIRVRTTDQSGRSFEKVLAVSVIDQPEGTSGNDAFTVTYSATGIDVTIATHSGPTTSLGSFPLDATLTLFGLGGIDSVTVVGSTGNDVFAVSGSGIEVNGSMLVLNDTEKLYLAGNAGDDTYRFDSSTTLGLISLDETGGGSDTLDFSTDTRGFRINLENSKNQILNSNLTVNLKSISTFENVFGGSGNDTITGNSLNNRLEGMGGIDTLIGGAGDDFLDGGTGNDTYRFNTNTPLGSDRVTDIAGIDRLYFLDSSDNVVVNLSLTAMQVINTNLTLTLDSAMSLENVYGGAGHDTLIGNTLNNILSGGRGADALNGAGGNDSLIIDDSDTSVLGGEGVDRVTVSGAAGSLNLNLTTGHIETVIATTSAFDNVFDATGADWNVSITGGTGSDKITGGDMNDVLVGGAGDDMLDGGAGNDTYRFNTNTPLGSDSVTDSAGIDLLYFFGSTNDLNVNLSLTTLQVVNTNLALTLGSATSMENLYGGAGNDTLIGNTLNNVLNGYAGDDILAGGDGNDVLTDGGGTNILIGGNGSDRLMGGLSGDLLLGARFALEADATALVGLFNEWTSGSVSFALSSVTVTEDNVRDTLRGGSGTDWYLRNSTGTLLASRDTTLDPDLDSVFTEIHTWL